jgi:GTP cyclohydrolase II
LIDSRSALHGPLLATDCRRLDTVFGPFELAEFRNLETHRSCFALSVGELGGQQPVLARVHSSCVTSEFFGACDCDCAAQLDGALEAIAAEGRGVVFYLDQEGRGAGLAAKARDRMIVQASRLQLTTFEAYERMGLRPDLRRYDEVAAMTVLLEIDAPFVLLTNNPGKVAALEREKLKISRLQPLEHTASPFNAHYLSAKRRSGHVLADASGTRDAELPAVVEAVEPLALPGRSELVRVARYLLPVRPARQPGGARQSAGLSEPVWLRLPLYIDAELGGELVVLTRDVADGSSALARIHPEPLLERFPLREAPARESWLRVVEALRTHGSGVVVFGRHGARGAPSASEREGAGVELLAHHLCGRSVVPLHSPGDPDPTEVLRARGLQVADARSLEPPG